jgi:hypothetical protein
MSFRVNNPSIDQESYLSQPANFLPDEIELKDIGLSHYVILCHGRIPSITYDGYAEDKIELPFNSSGGVRQRVIKYAFLVDSGCILTGSMLNALAICDADDSPKEVFKSTDVTDNLILNGNEIREGLPMGIYKCQENNAVLIAPVGDKTYLKNVIEYIIQYNKNETPENIIRMTFHVCRATSPSDPTQNITTFTPDDLSKSLEDLEIDEMKDLSKKFEKLTTGGKRKKKTKKQKHTLKRTKPKTIKQKRKQSKQKRKQKKTIKMFSKF